MLTLLPPEDGVRFAAQVRRMLEQSGGITQTRSVVDAGSEYDPATWRSLEMLDLAGVIIPAEQGGADAGIGTLIAAAAELGRVLVPSPFWSTAVLSAGLLTAAGTAEAAELLVQIAGDEVVITTALLDGQAGWEPGQVTVEASQDGDSFTLTGETAFVTDAACSDVILVPARHGGSTGVFAVTRAQAGAALRVSPLTCLDATRPLSRVSYDSAPARLIVAGEAAQAACKRALALSAVAMIAGGVGAADRCLEMTLDYARTRVQFGHVIGSYQAIKHRCADMFTRIESVRSAVYHAAAVLEHPGAHTEEVDTAVHTLLAVGPPRLLQCAGDTIQVHGGIGFTWDHDAHLYFKRAQADAQLLGDAAGHRQKLARSLGVLKPEAR